MTIGRRHPSKSYRDLLEQSQANTLPKLKEHIGKALANHVFLEVCVELERG
jgi:hypothetical protein